MKLKVDREADALYLTLDEALAAESEEVVPGVVIDYGAEGQVVGIEVLSLSRQAPNLDLTRLLYEMVPATERH